MNEDRKSNYWVTLVILLCLGWVMIWIYRSILTPIYPQVMNTLGLKTSKEISLIYSLYFLTYVLFQIPAGIISDKVDKKYILGGGFFIFSIAVFFMYRTNIAATFYVASAIAGIAGAFYYGAAFSLSNNEIPQSKRNLANAIINSGTAVGIIIGLNSASHFVIVGNYSWQSMLMGVSAVLFVTSILFFLKIKDNYNLSSKTEKVKSSKEEKGKGNYFTFMKITIYFVLFCSAYAYFMVISWLPNFLQAERGFGGNSAGIISSLVAIASLPGALFFSAIADKYNSKKFILMIVLLVLASITLFLSIYVVNTAVIIICLTAYGFLGKLALDPLLISSISEISNKYKLATSLSIYNFFGMSASFVAPYLAGSIADRTYSVAVAFYFASFILILGAAVLLMAIFFHKRVQV